MGAAVWASAAEARDTAQALTNRRVFRLVMEWVPPDVRVTAAPPRFRSAADLPGFRATSRTGKRAIFIRR